MDTAILLLRRSNLFFKKINKSVSLTVAILLMILTGLIVYFFFPRTPNVIVVNTKTNDCSDKLEEVRLKDYRFTHPLMLADIPNENSELTTLKEKINSLIAKDKSANMVNDVSVYFRKLNDASWFVINGEKGYLPASLMKVAYLIAVLKQDETSPGLLQKKIYFETRSSDTYNQNIKNFKLEEKKYYTIKELLHYMIAYSDNDALVLISQNTNTAIYNKIFSDLGIPAPPVEVAKGQDYVLTVTDYCKFFRILYNSGYITNEHSDWALSLLSESMYHGGFLKNINYDFPVAHKFGERVNGGIAQLHEVGIFYAGSQPYLLGVMTEGNNLGSLSDVLAQISELVYSDYNKGS